MGMTDKQFDAFLRLVIRVLKEALEKSDAEEKDEILKKLLGDLQTTLED